MNSIWPRRDWLIHQATLLAAFASSQVRQHSTHAHDRVPPAELTALEARVEPMLPSVLAVQAIDAARSAGASYADARLTRVVSLDLRGWDEVDPRITEDEWVGVGVRALVGGYWGFAASPFWTVDGVVRMAHDAVAQARANAQGPPRAVDLRATPVVTGTWATPIAIDPFTVPIEELIEAINSWKDSAERAGCRLNGGGVYSNIGFARQERVLATSEGSLVTQTLYESGGSIDCHLRAGVPGLGGGPTGLIARITPAGQGWERLLNANIPEQFATTMRDRILRQAAIDRTTRPSAVGRYTIVCDGATMASLVESTLGMATQLDRALGYEANAGGTSVLDHPLMMAGHFQVASPLVTVTANRSAPTQLATVQWDDEGVVPEPFTLVKDGVLVDFQTTREQAAWLAPYYQQHGRPVQSHGCAAAEDAHAITMQMMPNLALEPSAAAHSLEDLVADVADGLLIEGAVTACDFQVRTGLLLGGQMRRITHGKLGPKWTGGALQFETQDLWKNVRAVSGVQTEGGTEQGYFDRGFQKGQPSQRTSHSVRAVAATIANQPLTDLTS